MQYVNQIHIFLPKVMQTVIPSRWNSWDKFLFPSVAGSERLAQSRLGPLLYAWWFLTEISINSCHCWRNWSSSPDTWECHFAESHVQHTQKPKHCESSCWVHAGRFDLICLKCLSWLNIWSPDCWAQWVEKYVQSWRLHNGRQRLQCPGSLCIEWHNC